MKDAKLSGQCHCGAVQISVPALPTEVLQCNCSLCRKTGWTGGYWNPDDVVIDAKSEALNSYAQGDKTITLWNCRHCGSHTHWTPLTAPPERMGVNMRIFDFALLQDLPVRAVDGESF